MKNIVTDVSYYIKHHRISNYHLVACSYIIYLGLLDLSKLLRPLPFGQCCWLAIAAIVISSLVFCGVLFCLNYCQASPRHRVHQSMYIYIYMLCSMLCYMLCYMLYAICYMLCYMLYAMLYAICFMLYAMLYAICYMLYAIGYIYTLGYDISLSSLNEIPVRVIRGGLA